MSVGVQSWHIGRIRSEVELLCPIMQSTRRGKVCGEYWSAIWGGFRHECVSTPTEKDVSIGEILQVALTGRQETSRGVIGTLWMWDTVCHEFG